MFRGAQNALQPNWLHLPVGYHGRASSIVLSGADVVRPRGQLQADADETKGSMYGACRMLDFELEVGVFVGGPPTPVGRPLTIEEAEDHIFGMVLFNDWSARDIQRWEYVPLGPFTSKNFCSTISPWVVTLEALEPFRCPTSAGEQTDPVPLEYLRDPRYGSYDVTLDVLIQPEDSTEASLISRSNMRYLYWSVKQQLVHHTVTGCNIRPGDLFATGTISGPTEGSYGSMLEMSWRGSRDIPLTGGGVRKFLLDGDTVIMNGYCSAPGGSRVGFGSCIGKVLPAGSMDGVNVESVTLPNAFFHSFKLHGHWRSSCTWRVRNALALKGIPYERVFVGSSAEHAQADSHLVSVNRLMQVPVLEYQDAEGTTHTLTQSLPIVEFLDEAFPAGPKLVPRDLLLRARARMIAEICNSGIQPLHNKGVVKCVRTAGNDGELDGKGFAQWALRKGLRALEHEAAKGNGMVLVGSSVSIADVCLVPQLYAARRYEVSLEDYPTLQSVERYLLTLPAFQEAHGENQPDCSLP
jgi:fumarylacetoacetase